MSQKNISNYYIPGFTFYLPTKYVCSFSRCIFSSLTRTTPISADSVESSLFLEDCDFESIKGDKEGGCIHVNCLSQLTKISLNKVIAIGCETENRAGSFGHFKSKGNFDMIDTVISKCASMKTSAHYCVYIRCPKAIHQGGNMTDCYAYCDLLAFQTDDSKSDRCQFIRNELKIQAVVVFQIGVHVFQYSSVIDNSNENPTTNGRTLYPYETKKVTISNSYLKGNKARFLISTTSAQCVVLNCVVDNWNVEYISSSFGIVKSGAVPSTSVVYPVKLKDSCEYENQSKELKRSTLIALSLLAVMLSTEGG